VRTVAATGSLTEKELDRVSAGNAVFDWRQK